MLSMATPEWEIGRVAFLKCLGTATAMLSAMVFGAARTPRILGVRSISPRVCISRNPFQIPAIVQPSPTETATQFGTLQSSCSQVSNPAVFLPSTRYGLMAQLRLYQPHSAQA